MVLVCKYASVLNELFREDFLSFYITYGVNLCLKQVNVKNFADSFRSITFILTFSLPRVGLTEREGSRVFQDRGF